ncbi:MAG: leucine-rich repeat domain-containing protein [Alistipes sp.]|nr:leucine-rich repeat domain-containing protein [Alistipes sp.]
MKKLTTMLAAALLACTATAQTQTAYLDLYQRGGGQHLKTTLTFDGSPVDLGRRSLGETLNLLAGLGWEVDQTLVGANRVMFFPTRHKFHIILRKVFRAGENPFEGLHELQGSYIEADYAAHTPREKTQGRRTDAAKTERNAVRPPKPTANYEIRYKTYKASPVKANVLQHPDFAENVYLYDEHGVISFRHDIAEIPARAFQGCSELKTIVVPASVVIIGDAAFAGCQNLTHIYCMATTPPELGNTAITSRYCKICVPAEAAESYKTADGWSAYADRIAGYGSER